MLILPVRNKRSTMKFSFKAEVYKVGINPCVKVPLRITAKMKPSKGYIPVKGKINGHSFLQTLVPVKEEPYRLYVNGPMLKAANIAVGDMATFNIEQNLVPVRFSMPKEFRKELNENGLMPAFKKLTPGRQKEILRYLGFLKTKETLLRNIDKDINQLKKN
jgi:hypothetical protein